MSRRSTGWARMCVRAQIGVKGPRVGGGLGGSDEWEGHARPDESVADMRLRTAPMSVKAAPGHPNQALILESAQPSRPDGPGHHTLPGGRVCPHTLLLPRYRKGVCPHATEKGLALTPSFCQRGAKARIKAINCLTASQHIRLPHTAHTAAPQLPHSTQLPHKKRSNLHDRREAVLGTTALSIGGRRRNRRCRRLPSRAAAARAAAAHACCERSSKPSHPLAKPFIVEHRRARRLLELFRCDM